jgi:hypothetical protein
VAADQRQEIFLSRPSMHAAADANCSFGVLCYVLQPPLLPLLLLLLLLLWEEEGADDEKSSCCCRCYCFFFVRRRVPTTSCSQLTLTATKEQQSEKCVDFCGYLRPRQWILLIILIRPNIEIALQKIFVSKLDATVLFFKKSVKKTENESVEEC